MTDAARQQTRRKKVKEEGLVDIRVEVPLALREALKANAASCGMTLKNYIKAVLEAEYGESR